MLQYVSLHMGYWYKECDSETKKEAERERQNKADPVTQKLKAEKRAVTVQALAPAVNLAVKYRLSMLTSAQPMKTQSTMKSVSQLPS